MIEEFERPLSLVEATMKGIRSAIIGGNLSLGQILTESYLQKSFGFMQLFGLGRMNLKCCLALFEASFRIKLHSNFTIAVFCKG